MSKHTPGPWTWNESETDKRSRPYVRCSIKLPGSVNNVAVAKVTGQGPEMAANACLIAAAPDLLNAVKQWEIILRADATDTKTWEAVCRLIARAEGA